MKDDELFQGFDSCFLKDGRVDEEVSLPKLGPEMQKDLVLIPGNDQAIFHYIHYSLQLSRSRKFPIYTATNIDGNLLKKAERAASWKMDTRAKNFQWGSTFYSAPKSDFDKGHMTRREDVQWGATVELAQKAADSTFYYTNAVPQHKNLNQKIWKSLEDYILHKQCDPNDQKICVFTGPVLSKDDPDFVSNIKNETVQMPVLFWKIVVYPKKDGKLYRVGFMMSQRQLLEKDDTIKTKLKRSRSEDYMNFDQADTYQVNVSLIEELTGLTFYAAIDSYTDKRSIQLVLSQIDTSITRIGHSMRNSITIQNIIL